MDRSDTSNQLIYFMKGNTWDAFDHLHKIVSQRAILGARNFRKGGITCVCMTETPLKSLSEGLRSCSGHSPYSPFGVMFDKKWVFSKGGRPVIYGPESDYELLPESLRWRHVRYDPTTVPPFDFTWEREWRTPCAVLPFGPHDATIVLPSLDWMEEFPEVWPSRQAEDGSLRSDSRLYELIDEMFPWQVVSLDGTKLGPI